MSLLINGTDIASLGIRIYYDDAESLTPEIRPNTKEQPSAGSINYGASHGDYVFPFSAKATLRPPYTDVRDQVRAFAELFIDVNGEWKEVQVEWDKWGNVIRTCQLVTGIKLEIQSEKFVDFSFTLTDYRPFAKLKTGFSKSGSIDLSTTGEFHIPIDYTQNRRTGFKFNFTGSLSYMLMDVVQQNGSKSTFQYGQSILQDPNNIDGTALINRFNSYFTQRDAMANQVTGEEPGNPWLVERTLDFTGKDTGDTSVNLNQLNGSGVTSRQLPYTLPEVISPLYRTVEAIDGFTGSQEAYIMPDGRFTRTIPATNILDSTSQDWQVYDFTGWDTPQLGIFQLSALGLSPGDYVCTSIEISQDSDSQSDVGGVRLSFRNDSDVQLATNLSTVVRVTAGSTVYDFNTVQIPVGTTNFVVSAVGGWDGTTRKKGRFRNAKVSIGQHTGIYTPSPTQDPENAYPRYKGNSTLGSNNPNDYKWRIGTYDADRMAQLIATFQTLPSFTNYDAEFFTRRGITNNTALIYYVRHNLLRLNFRAIAGSSTVDTPRLTHKVYSITAGWSDRERTTNTTGLEDISLDLRRSTDSELMQFLINDSGQAFSTLYTPLRGTSEAALIRADYIALQLAFSDHQTTINDFQPLLADNKLTPEELVKFNNMLSRLTWEYQTLRTKNPNSSAGLTSAYNALIRFIGQNYNTTLKIDFNDFTIVDNGVNTLQRAKGDFVFINKETEEIVLHGDLKGSYSLTYTPETIF